MLSPVAQPGIHSGNLEREPEGVEMAPAEPKDAEQEQIPQKGVEVVQKKHLTVPESTGCARRLVCCSHERCPCISCQLLLEGCEKRKGGESSKVGKKVTLVEKNFA